MKIPVVLHTDDGVRFGVTIPDLPGCFSSGRSMDDALASAIEAARFHIEGLARDGFAPPVLMPLAEHQANPEYVSGHWEFIEV